MQGKQLCLYVTKAIQGKQLKHKHQILRNIGQIGQFKLYLSLSFTRVLGKWKEKDMQDI